MTTLDAPPEDPIERLGNELRLLFGDWGLSGRRLVTRASERIRTRTTRWWAGVRAWAARTGAAKRYMLDPAEVWRRRDAAALSAAAAMGLRAFGAGLLLSGAYALSNGGSIGQAVAPALTEIVWALGRYLVVALLVPPGELPRVRLAAAVLAGLAPYLFGVTPSLRLAALAASALLTFAGLTGAGLSGRHARRAVAWAFGGQIGAIAAGWAVRAGIAALIA